MSDRVLQPDATPSLATLPRFRCAGCGWEATAGVAVPLACPQAVGGDDVDHVLAWQLGSETIPSPDEGTDNPFIRYRARFHAWHAGREAGWTDDRYVALVRRLDDAVAGVDGHGFRVTPFARQASLSERLGFSARGGVWVKDETGNVSGSHKARHLFGTLLELEVADEIAGRTGDPASRPPLAIASCGNAGLAAAVVAAAAGRPLDVFIPPDADPAVVGRLRALGARLEVCPRVPGTSGDPTVARLLEAVAAGSIPFTCQGNLNGFAVEGGLTLGWEMADAIAAAGTALDRLIVQVGGGALAAAACGGLGTAGASRQRVRVDTVQTGGAYPLARALDRLAGLIAAGATVDDALTFAACHRSRFMWAWEDEPRSVAHGILDDETYDWLAVARGMLTSGGSVVVVDEATLLEANELARSSTGIDVDHTGSSGLAGLLHLCRQGVVRPDECVAVLFTGVVRRSAADQPEQPAAVANHQSHDQGQAHLEDSSS